MANIEFKIFEILKNCGIKSEYSYELITNEGLKCILKLTNNNAEIFIKINESNIITLSEYISNSTLVNSGEIIELTSELIQIIEKGIA